MLGDGRADVSTRGADINAIQYNTIQRNAMAMPSNTVQCNAVTDVKQKPYRRYFEQRAAATSLIADPAQAGSKKRTPMKTTSRFTEMS